MSNLIYPYECKTLAELTENKQEYLELKELEDNFFSQEVYISFRECRLFKYTRISYEINPFDETYDSLRIYETRPACSLDDQDQDQNKYQEF
mgnify:CR=1 FL=1|jgi:hypothetical protein